MTRLGRGILLDSRRIPRRFGDGYAEGSMDASHDIPSNNEGYMKVGYT
jgi:hypothetical protein